MRFLKIALLSAGLASLLLIALVAIQAPEMAQALPPRPNTEDSREVHIPGGFITLTVDGDVAEWWTAVQWQDHNDNWHLVDGWQGSTDADGNVRWYVGQDNLGDGPFRWLIYDAQGGNMLTTSEAFELPTQAGETVAVTVTIP